MPTACGSEKDLWSEQISKIAKRFLRFARSSLVFGGEAAELQPEFTLNFKEAHVFEKLQSNFSKTCASKEFYSLPTEVGTVA
jgi:hypothetical protein